MQGSQSQSVFSQAHGDYSEIQTLFQKRRSETKTLLQRRDEGCYKGLIYYMHLNKVALKKQIAAVVKQGQGTTTLAPSTKEGTVVLCSNHAQ